MSVGHFVDGPLCGVTYRTSTRDGITDSTGAFEYAEGEDVAFSIGRLSLGSAQGAERLSEVDLAHAETIVAVGVTNRARFLQSIGGDLDLADGIIVTEAVRAAVDELVPTLEFDCAEEDFDRRQDLQALFEKLGLRLRTPAEARNHLRRSIAGIKKLTDVAIPVRDGSHLLCDVLRPTAPGRYPVILGLSVYGRGWGIGSVCSEDERLERARREDDWFEKPREQMHPTERYAENFVRANATDFVPRGYVLVRIDPRGIGRTPGVLSPYSKQEAEDYYDAIEWAAREPWSDGNVGLFGASYAGTVQWSVARMKPPSLKAIVPWTPDVDAYRELAYPGGIFHGGHREVWWNDLVAPQQCGSGEAVDFIGGLVSHPFDDEAYYGPDGSGPVSAELEAIEVPFLTSVSQAYIMHSRGGFEAFTRASSDWRQLIVLDGNYHSFMYEDCLGDQLAFFERFLKGRDDAPVPPKVRLVMRTGGGEFEWRDEKDWPVPGTDYRRFYLDASVDRPSTATGTSAFGLASVQPSGEGKSSYSAEVHPDSDLSSLGVSYISDPLVEPLELAGHVNASLWVSSTAYDMDVFVCLRVVAPDGSELHYPVRNPASIAPVTYGCLKVSQRALDERRSTVARPWHTHRESDRQPLESSEEIVGIEVELYPMTARIPAGHRLRVDVQPVEGGFFPDIRTGRPKPRAYDKSYHDGAVNAIHTGPQHPGHIRLPVVPAPAERHRGD